MDLPARSWTWEQVSRRRLRRHGLAAGSAFASVAEAAGAICGAHAQVHSAGELSLGLRVTGATQSDVQDALWRARSLVRTFGPRGTVHLLPLAELPLWTGALSVTPIVTPGQFPDGVRLEPHEVDAVVDAVGASLADAELTVDELTEAVVDRAGAWAGELVMPAFQGMWPRWRQATAIAASRGVLCFGPNRGRKVTYTNPHRWLPDLRPEPDGLPHLVRRYLHAYGPATPREFARWMAAPPAWGVELFASLEGDLTEVAVEGRPAFVWAGDEDPDDADGGGAGALEALAGVRLLPYFDAFAVGCYPRDLLFPGRAGERALAGSQAGNFPVLLVDGTVAGVWHQRRAGRTIEVTVEPLRRLSARRQAALAEQVERVGAFFDRPVRHAIGTVTVGAHA